MRFMAWAASRLDPSRRLDAQPQVKSMEIFLVFQGTWSTGFWLSGFHQFYAIWLLVVIYCLCVSGDCRIPKNIARWFSRLKETNSCCCRFFGEVGFTSILRLVGIPSRNMFSSRNALGFQLELIELTKSYWTVLWLYLWLNLKDIHLRHLVLAKGQRFRMESRCWMVLVAHFPFHMRWVSVEKHQWRPDRSTLPFEGRLQIASRKNPTKCIKPAAFDDFKGKPRNDRQFFQVFGRAPLPRSCKLLRYHPCTREIPAKMKPWANWDLFPGKQGLGTCWNGGPRVATWVGTMGPWEAGEHPTEPRLGDLQLRLDANDGKLKSLQEATAGFGWVIFADLSWCHPPWNIMDRPWRYHGILWKYHGNTIDTLWLFMMLCVHMSTSAHLLARKFAPSWLWRRRSWVLGDEPQKMITYF